MKVNCTSLLAAFAVAAIAPLAAAQSNCCAPGAPGQLGCDDPDCQALVCGADAFCCNTQWDSLCSDAAIANCAVCAGGGKSTCCSPQGTPGCDDQACQDAVCAVDAFCCNTSWDSVCVGEAQDLCGDLCPSAGPCPGTNDCCLPGDGSVGCNDEACCNAVCALDPFCCETAWDSVCATEAATECPKLCGGGNPACPGAGDCCSANGGLGCNDEACCNTVCAADPFCCQTAWDSICAGEALTMCGDLCTGGGSNCCFANGGLGCDNPDCQAAVCAADPFCCETAWDSICASEAVALCGELCIVSNPACPGTNDCCVPSPDGTPGCSDEVCCNTVCASDPFCCDTMWDSLCANAAIGLCGCVVSCPVSDHDCYTEGVAGCTDEACCSQVCAVDPFCCQTAWDAICVSEAFTICGVPPCPFECTGTDEGEPCGSDLNGGCNTPPSGNSTCCFANGGIGCDDQFCQDTVCAVDSFCCATAWDGICASEAIALCGDLCAFVPLFGNISCGETICGTAWASGGTRDTDWFIFTVPGPDPTLVTVSISNQIPMVIGLINSTDCSTASSLNPFAVSGYCGTASFTHCFAPGTYWLFAGPNGFDGFPCEAGVNEYALTVECGETCVPLGCGSAGHDCYTAGGPYCDDVSCCETVCAVDPFCCDVGWDGICVNEAFSFCGTPKCPFECEGTSEGEDCGEDNNGGCNVPVGGDSNCCIANGGIGCDDQTCQDAVCAVDPFCCDTAWDGICAGEAVTLCPDVCTLGVPSFGEISCNETVCASAWADGNFRDTDWYILTLAEDTEITIKVDTQLPLIAGLVDTTDCATAGFIDPFILVDFCSSGSLTVSLPAGVHWVFAAPNAFSGFPCGSGANEYSISINCPIDCVFNPDQNGDGCVNGGDITVVLGNWAPAGPGLGAGDVNCDGVVDGGDITAILGEWLTGPNCP